MMDSTRRSMLNRIEEEIARLPRDDPRRNKIKFIRYGLLYGAGTAGLSRALQAARKRRENISSPE